jgi:Putative lumazine-binding
MKRLGLLITAALLLCLPTYVRAQGSKPSGDEAEIWQVGRDYFDAWENSSIERMKTILHPKARLFLGSKTDLVAQTPSQLYANFKSNARQKNSIPSRVKGSWKVENIEVIGDVAAMRLEINYPTLKVTHQFSLMKFVDGWKIVSRVTFVDSNM